MRLLVNTYFPIIKSILIGSLTFIITCTAINFEDTSDENNPKITLENEKDTITVGDAYVPQFTVEDDKDSEQDLLDNVKIWIEDEDGEVIAIMTFTDNPGMYYVYLVVTDSDGNKSDTTVGIVVVSEEDKTAPVITLLGPVPYLLNLGDPYNEPGARAIDNIDGDISGQVEISGDVVNTSSEGDYILTYRVSDEAGNEAAAKRTVTVKDSEGNDKEKPEITILGDNPFSLYIGENYEDPGAEATDNVDGDLTSDMEVFGASINTSVADTHKVYYTVEDAAGNIALETRTVIVKYYDDTIPPVITLLGDNPMNLNKEEEYIESGATAEDNVDGDITNEINIDNDEVNVFENGIYKVYYKVSDAAGNETEEIRTVIVGIIDTVPPEITLLGDNPMIVDYGGTYKEPGAYAMDSVGDVVDSIPFSQFTVDKDINVNELGTYKVIYTVSDASGNETSAEREVEVADTIAPVITINGPNPINLGLGFPYTEYGATAVDNYDGDLTDQLDTIGDVNTTVGGTYIVTYTVTDQHDNVGIGERIISVAKDTDPPVLILLGDNPMFLFLGSTYIEPGATAYDSVDGDLTDKIIIDNSSVNTSVAGTYKVTYTVSDTGGNSANDERSVVVDEDTEPPVITLKGDNPMAVFLGEPYVEPGATATDNVDGDLTDEIEIDNQNVNTSVAGTYIVTYSVSDASGNESEKTREVIVSQDDEPPVITLLGNNPLKLDLNADYNDPGASAYDNVDGDITDKIVTSGTVNTAVPDTYTVTYSVSDNAGNNAEKTRDVIVIDAVVLSSGDNGTTQFTINEKTSYKIPIQTTGTIAINKFNGVSITISVNGGSPVTSGSGQWYWSKANISADSEGYALITIVPSGSLIHNFQWW